MRRFYLKRNRMAFTVVELLTVIAIIGILSGLVMVILGTVRAKARDSYIRSDINQLAVDADVWGTKHNNDWNGWCSQGEGTNFENLKENIAANNGDIQPECYFTPSTWVIVALLTNGTTNICADSGGRLTTNEMGTDYTGETFGGYYVGATSCVGTPI